VISGFFGQVIATYDNIFNSIISTYSLYW